MKPSIKAALSAWAPFFLCMAAILIVYLPSIEYGILWHDDELLISHRQAMPGLEGFKLAWSQGFFMNQSAYWRPLGLWSFQLGNLAPEPMRMSVQHGMQIGFALAWAGLLLLHARQVGRSCGIPGFEWAAPLIAASAFPMEGTLWISARFDLLLGMCCLGAASSALSFLKSSTRPPMGSLLACAAWIGAGLLSKESSPFWLAASLASSWALLLASGKLASGCRREAMLSALLLALASAWIVAYLASSSMRAEFISVHGSIHDLQLGGYAISESIAFFALPWAFHQVAHSIPLAGMGPGSLAGLAAMCAIAATFAWRARLRDWGGAALALLWFAGLASMGALAASDPSRTVMGEFTMSERYCLPMLPLMLATLGIAASRWAPSLPNAAKLPWTWAIILAWTLSAALSSWQSASFSSGLLYWQKTMAAGDSTLGAHFVGAIQWNQGQRRQGTQTMLDRIEKLDLSDSPWASAAKAWNQELIGDAIDLLTRGGEAAQGAAIGARWMAKGQAFEPILVNTASAYAAEGSCAQAAQTRALVAKLPKQFSDDAQIFEIRTARFYRYNLLMDFRCPGVQAHGTSADAKAKADIDAHDGHAMKDRGKP